MTKSPCRVLVLSRRDSYEAMRVAAGLTIRNNQVDFVFLNDPPVLDNGRLAHGEMMELSEITPLCLTPAPLADIQQITQDHLSQLIRNADRVVSF